MPVLPPDVAQVEAWLHGLRGSKVRVRVPQRGDKKDLAETVRRNAEQALALHRTKRAGDLTTRSQALQEITEALGLDSAPLRIECYDISTTQGTHQVGSMVVFEDGLPRKSEYRHFVVRGEDGSGARDDTTAMHEVLTRRFRRYLDDVAQNGSPDLGEGPLPSGEVSATDGARPGRFAYPPQLVVVDGGAPAGRCRGARAGRARHPGRGAVRARQAPGGGLGAGGGVPGRSCGAARRVSTCSSGCATRPTGSRSSATGPGAAPG